MLRFLHWRVVYQNSDIIVNSNKTRRETQEAVLDPSDVFTTYDLGCSAALVCSRFVLLSIDKENPRKALFVFRREEGIDDAAQKYWTDQLQVPARAFFDTIKMLKNRLYSSQ